MGAQDQEGEEEKLEWFMVMLDLVEQEGNCGTGRAEEGRLCSVGRGTLTRDGLAIAAAVV